MAIARLSTAFLISALAAGATLSQSPRTLASFTERFTTDPHVSPDGRFVLLPRRTELLVYNVATKKTTKLADGPSQGLEWSRRMDRIAWVRHGDDGKGVYVWTMPIDPSTAAPTGPAQRVSPGQSHQPAISFDGKWIAYQSPESATVNVEAGFQPHRLVVAPVTGGPERTIAHFATAFEGEFWSADGKSIFAAANPIGTPKARITKIYLDGRAPEVIRADSAEWVTGITPDRGFLVNVPARNPISAKDRAIVMDTTGREVGRVPLPVSTTNEYDTPIDSSLVWVTVSNNQRLEVRSLDGSAPRRLALPTSPESPMWSPDGKRIAFQVREGGHNRLAVVNADGADFEVFHDTDLRPDQRAAHWSPDSKSIAYERADWHALVEFDIASHRTRLIVEDTASRIGLWTWRPDGQSIAAVFVHETPTPGGNIDEVRLDGGRRPLLDFSRYRQTNTGFQFIDANNIVMRTDSVAFTAALGGAFKRLAAIPPGSKTAYSAVSHDGRLYAGLLVNPPKSDVDQVEILSLDNGQRRTIDLPFRLGYGMQPTFSRDDRTMFVLGRPAGDTTAARVYAVPVNGDSPRQVAIVGDASWPSMSLSPDGKSIVYTVLDTRTTSLLLVDLRPAMKASAVRTGASRKP